MRPQSLLTISWKFAVNFFARGLHTRPAVVRLPLRQLGFLVRKRECNTDQLCTELGGFHNKTMTLGFLADNSLK